MKFVILKTTVGDREAFQRHLEDHRNYLESLHRRGLLVTAGTFDDRTGGMLIIKARDLEQAIHLALEDPLVQAGVDRYMVRGWVPAVGSELDLDEPEEANSRQLKLVDTGPLFVPSGENFTVIDAAEHPRHGELMSRCFAPNHISGSDPNRRDYLRLTENRGLRKLLLLHGEELAGQIEFAPPEVSGLPIEGDRLAVINCLWIKDAYTGLEGGRRLLAACANRSSGTALATIGYNPTLPWLPKSFFERQGFVQLDEMETGRFFGDTPIVAYLLWRPLFENLEPPTWDRKKLAEGISFCPGYPWMFGKRLYWGRDYPYQGTVVKEGLRRTELLEQFPCLGKKRIDRWTVVKLGIPAADLNRAVELIQSALIAEPTYFASLSGVDEMIVIYPDKVFRAGADPSTWTDAIRYGLDRGIPEEELVFLPPF
jgi:uncharacterized protein YciI